jgi:hypothetical protein
MVTSYLQVFDNKWPQFSNNTFTSLDKMFADYVEANPKKSAEVYALQAKCLSIYLKNIPLNRSERLMRNEQVHFFKQFKKMETAGMDSVPDQLLFQIFQKFDNSTAEQTNYIAFDVYNYFTQQIANSSKKKSEKYSTRFNHFVRNYPGLFNNKKPCRFDKEYCFTEWDKPEYLWAATTINASYLTDDEKDIIYLMNLARLNPKLFNNTFVKTYLKEGPKTSYERSLVSFLDNCKPVQLLYPSGQLSQAAAYHAKDMGEKDMTGHTSSDRTSFPKRLKRYWVDPYVGENCSYGPNDPLDIVMQLMIDEGVPNLGHRVNIFTADYFFTGVSVAPHKTYRWNSVMDFAGGTE